MWTIVRQTAVSMSAMSGAQGGCSWSTALAGVVEGGSGGGREGGAGERDKAQGSSKEAFSFDGNTLRTAALIGAHCVAALPSTVRPVLV
ncbi:hypothetical protein CLOP_g22114 [Closterium sp. NIES-67]|nr:hypothetical protein CLOP_g22114 [Closterium sp. NIES-67]